MKGTARFMAMGGAFGALGGDLSSLSQNPAGIGVYRNNEIGFTLDLDCQRSNSQTEAGSFAIDNTKFLLNNIGAVFTMRLGSSTFPNFNVGFTYNKGASFNREYEGEMGLQNSMSNYIAGIANGENLTVGDLTTTDDFNPYNPGDYYASPWLAILGYDSFLISPQGKEDNPSWFGQWGNGTKGSGRFHVVEKGSLDEYNIALGGNIANVVYWGMNFDIVNFNYTMNSMWGEQLDNANVMLDEKVGMQRMRADWNLSNYYNVNGTGFNYQLGIIVKPIQELRLGFAFHTPTWYSLTENFGAGTSFRYGDGETFGAKTNNGQLAYNDMNFRTPWKLMASVAGVIGGRFIISADYEWEPMHAMRFSQPSSYGYGGGWDDGWDDGAWDDDWGWDPWYKPGSQAAPAKKSSLNDPYYATNEDIRRYYRSTNTLRLGAEYRVTPQFSVRAGYSFVSSPVQQKAKDGKEIIYTSGTMPNYVFDNTTNYISAGVGYKYKKFYIDLAYVYKRQSAEYHAYTSDPANPEIPSPKADVTFNNSQVVMSAGFRF